jgi:thiol-disulfide isomerase/thioredoxin
MVTDPSAPDQPPGTGQPRHRPGAGRHAAQHRARRRPRRAAGRGHRGLLALPVILAVIGLAVAACVGPRPLGDGQDAASFSLPQLTSLRSGQRIALRSYAGRPVIVNFFASWSPPCTAETQLLAHFYRFYHGKVQIIGVDSRDNRGAALRLLHRSLVTYPVANDPNLVVAARYRVPGIPATFFLNARHQVVRADFGWLNWKKLRAGVHEMDES